MGLLGFNQIGKAMHDEGKFHYQYVYKASLPNPSAVNYFIDANQSTGLPKYNPFAGPELTSVPLVGAGNAGIYPGNFIDGKSKYLIQFQVLNNNTLNSEYLYLNDYLMFYPLIDCDNIDEQVMTNIEPLPRYASGEGVRIVLVATAPMVQTAPVTILYTNSEGVSGRSVTVNVIPAPAIGVCATAGGGTAGTVSQASPFIPLAGGDKGVRSIDSITFGSGAGGFIVACLVKPLANIMIYELNVSSEITYGYNQLKPPEILPGAYLNFLVHHNSAAVPSIRAELIFTNS